MRSSGNQRGARFDSNLGFHLPYLTPSGTTSEGQGAQFRTKISASCFRDSLFLCAPRLLGFLHDATECVVLVVTSVRREALVDGVVRHLSAIRFRTAPHSFASRLSKGSASPWAGEGLQAHTSRARPSGQAGDAS